MRWMLVWTGLVISLLLSNPSIAQQSAKPRATGKAPKLCVAAVGNGSLKPIHVNVVHEELVKQLLAAGLNPEATSSATLVAKQLEISGNNRDSIKLRKCDFMLLTAIDSPQPKVADPRSSAGASGGVSAPGSESDLLLSFALFQMKVQKPLIDTSVEAPNIDPPTQAVLTVLSKEVEKVAHALPKK